MQTPLTPYRDINKNIAHRLAAELIQRNIPFRVEPKPLTTHPNGIVRFKVDEQYGNILWNVQI